MSKEAWVSKRFWFGFGSILCGAFVAAFAGDDTIAPWIVKLFGVGSSTCGGVIMLLAPVERRHQRLGGVRGTMATRGVGRVEVEERPHGRCGEPVTGVAVAPGEVRALRSRGVVREALPHRRRRCAGRRVRATVERAGATAEVAGLVREEPLPRPDRRRAGLHTGGVEVEGVMVQKMRLGAPDATGRQQVAAIEREVFFA